MLLLYKIPSDTKYKLWPCIQLTRVQSPAPDMAPALPRVTPNTARSNPYAPPGVVQPKKVNMLVGLIKSIEAIYVMYSKNVLRNIFTLKKYPCL